ncbi:MAG: helix-hairpin-helix domain-containing protein [Kofleriaceae bacterium]|nr:helix-hairpin-helix domain-containing protein [Kofleriaceae bacterium]
MTPILAACALLFAMGGTWMTASTARAAPAAQALTTPAHDDARAPRAAKKDVAGKLNLNTATEEQLMMLPSVGPAKAERIVTWRKKNGGFKRIADLRRVKGFGYRTFKRLEPLLDVKGETTLAAKTSSGP